MKRLSDFLFTVAVLAAIFVVVALMFCAFAALAYPKYFPNPEPTEYVSYSIVEVVDSRYDPPNTYELCYRTTFSNGLTIDCWKMVSREEYEKEVGE